jgi:hypothetical protein
MAIVNAVIWLREHGEQYRKEHVERKPQTVLALEVLLDVHQANFFPFGLKEHRLARYMRKLPARSACGVVKWWALIVFQKVFFQFQWLAAVSSAFLIFTAHVPSRIMWVPRNVYGGLGAALGFVLMLCVILIACESFISYVVLGSYGAAFHHLDVRRRRLLKEAVHPASLLQLPEDKNLAIVEMVAYAGVLIIASVVMASATYFISMQLGGFAALGGRINPGFIDVRRLFDAAYSTVNIAGGSSEASPVSVLAMLFSMMGTVAYFLLIVITLAGLTSVAIKESGKSLRP